MIAQKAAERAAVNRKLQLHFSDWHRRSGRLEHLVIAEEYRKAADACGYAAAVRLKPDLPDPRPSLLRRIAEFFGVAR